MKRFIICLLLILQTFFAAYAGAAPAIPPRPAAGSGIYVQDNAGVISEDDKQQMLSLGAELDNKTTAQLAVLTINTLDGELLRITLWRFCANGALAARSRITVRSLSSPSRTDARALKLAMVWKARCLTVLPDVSRTSI